MSDFLTCIFSVIYLFFGVSLQVEKCRLARSDKFVGETGVTCKPDHLLKKVFSFLVNFSVDFFVLPDAKFSVFAFNFFFVAVFEKIFFLLLTYIISIKKVKNPS